MPPQIYTFLWEVELYSNGIPGQTLASLGKNINLVFGKNLKLLIDYLCVSEPPVVLHFHAVIIMQVCA